MEQVNCDYCNSSSYRNVASQTDLIHKSTQEIFNVVECNSCGLNFTNPRPNTDEIGKYYSESYTFHHNSGLKAFVKKSFIGKVIKFIANSPIAYLFIFIPPISNFLGSQVRPSIKDPIIEIIKNESSKNFLDIGCGSGLNAHFWGKQSSLIKLNNIIKVYGCEIDKDSRDYLNNLNIKCWSKIDEIESKKKFDLIRMNWSLEHAHYPSQYFEFFTKHLTSDGNAIIAVPNNNGILYKLEPNSLELPIHLHHFSIKTIQNYCMKNNLEIVNYFTFSYSSMFYYARDIGLLSKKFNYPKGIIHAKRFQVLLNAFDKFGLGNDLVVTLKKKKPVQNNL